MTRRAASFRQDDIKRAVAGAQAAGLDVARIEVDPVSGKVVIYATGAAGASGNPWDEFHR